MRNGKLRGEFPPPGQAPYAKRQTTGGWGHPPTWAGGGSCNLGRDRMRNGKLRGEFPPPGQAPYAKRQTTEVGGIPQPGQGRYAKRQTTGVGAYRKLGRDRMPNDKLRGRDPGTWADPVCESTTHAYTSVPTQRMRIRLCRPKRDIYHLFGNLELVRCFWHMAPRIYKLQTSTPRGLSRL